PTRGPSTRPHPNKRRRALFFELAGRELIGGFRWFGLSSYDTYDGRAVIRRETDRPDLLSTVTETDLKVVEFKLRGATIARDFDREEKHIEDIDLVICYEVGMSPLDIYQILDWESSTTYRNGTEPFPHVNSVLLDTITGREVQMLALRNLLDPEIIEEPPELSDDAADKD
ncbi:MAG: hypothetical protein OXP28_11945, partial [Gammaproteobacteria bacterium]|nr:hypothetical protein [Gammaproteobacteria bacterium]